MRGSCQERDATKRETRCYKIQHRLAPTFHGNHRIAKTSWMAESHRTRCWPHLAFFRLEPRNRYRGAARIFGGDWRGPGVAWRDRRRRGRTFEFRKTCRGLLHGPVETPQTA